MNSFFGIARASRCLQRVVLLFEASSSAPSTQNNINKDEKLREGLFDIKVEEVDGRAKISWTKKESWQTWSSLSEGCYLLRTNVMDWSAEELWQAYVQLTEAEAAFRIEKSDLKIRPIWHQGVD